jgi:hypothetical protein
VHAETRLMEMLPLVLLALACWGWLLWILEDGEDKE